ncbi:MAG: hypothetical protein H6Q89_2978 [Myxococcaceae bacterium]|nr:hypothetical protein [Myxococcaceae bacterium]
MLVFTFGDTSPAAAPAECVRLSGSQIGQLPLVVDLAGQRVEFTEWKATDITATELIGFTAQAPTDFHFTVEAGGSKFPATANWLHPAGVVGPQVRPIRALTICAN